MENAITAGLSKQIVLTRALDIAANNIANQSTTGFKSEKISFKEYVTSVYDSQTGENNVSLVHDVNSFTDFSLGSFQSTGAPLDFAIAGDGFFAVQTETGTAYTRDGHFGLNAFGELVTRDGLPVLDQGGAPILIDIDRGPITASKTGELQQEGTVIGQLGVFTFEDNRVLQRTSGNLFITENPSVAIPVQTSIEQGFIEGANVSSVSAMTEMIQILRAYENAAAVVETSNDLARDAVRTLTENA